MSPLPYRLRDAIRVGEQDGEVVTVRTGRATQVLGVRLPDGEIISVTVPLSPIPNPERLAFSGAVKPLNWR